jgi:inositol polyphosphate 1-phosphatase
MIFLHCDVIFLIAFTDQGMGTRFLELLLKTSEKAANIARVIRQDEHLFKLLVQEKKGSDKNPRFVQDFKTLADVLIQETVKHDVGNQVLLLI